MITALLFVSLTFTQTFNPIIPPKPEYDKISSRLWRDNNLLLQGKSKVELSAFTANLYNDKEILVLAYLESDDALSSLSLPNGVRVYTSYEDKAELLVEPAALLALAQLPEVMFVDICPTMIALGTLPPVVPDYLPPEATRRYAPMEKTSEGFGKTLANIYHDAGYKGKGINVAVFDLGFYGYEYAKSNNELYSRLRTKSFYGVEDGGTGDINGSNQPHGTACAEVVFDYAPEARQYLVNYRTSGEFSMALDYARAEGINVISQSLGSVIGPFDGTSYQSRLVDRAATDGIFFANAAGNEAESHWGGLFTDSNGNGWHEWGSSNGQLVEFLPVAAYNGTMILNWEDWPYTGIDYDLYAVNESGETIELSDIRQTGRQPPVEAVFVRGNRTVGIGVYKDNNSDPENARIDFYASNCYLGISTASQSLSIPSDAKKCFTVGAVNWSEERLKGYSSQGPTADGRIKPDIAAPTDVSTLIYGDGAFGGTSAACPHAAGAATLILSAKPTMPVDSVAEILRDAAFDKGTDGMDNRYGAGVLRLPPLNWLDNYLPLFSENKINYFSSNPERFFGGKNGDIIGIIIEPPEGYNPYQLANVGVFFGSSGRFQLIFMDKARTRTIAISEELQSNINSTDGNLQQYDVSNIKALHFLTESIFIGVKFIEDSAPKIGYISGNENNICWMYRVSKDEWSNPSSSYYFTADIRYWHKPEMDIENTISKFDIVFKSNIVTKEQGLNFYFPVNELLSVELYNLNGQLVQVKNLNGDVNQLINMPLNRIPAGIYWAVVKSIGEEVPQKIVVVD